MYRLASFAAVYAVAHYRQLSGAAFGWLFLALLQACEVVDLTGLEVPVVMSAGNLVLGLLLATALVLEARHGRWSGRSIDPHWRAAGLAPVVVAFVIGNGAKRGGTPFCRPDSLLQGHAAWNLGVVAAYCLYRLHASDRAVSGASRA
jgi:hypothetical protein